MSPSESSSDFTPLTGHCACGTLTYSLTAAPLITHCCHCTYCQLETGTAFAVNSAIERYNFAITSAAQPVFAQRPAPSGATHWVAHCPNAECNVDVFAHYGGNRATVYVKVGTLDGGSRGRVRPDVHIFTRSKVEWVDLRSEVERGVKVCEEFYDKGDVWSKESLERLEKLSAWKAQQGKQETAV